MCNSCRPARPAYCRQLRALGVTDPGGFAESVAAPAGKGSPSVRTSDLENQIGHAEVGRPSRAIAPRWLVPPVAVVRAAGLRSGEPEACG